MRKAYYLIGWGYVAICLAVILPARSRAVPEGGYALGVSSGYSAAEWFRRAKPYCNSVEIAVMQRREPAPKTLQGAGFEAACYALAGRIDDARRIIDRLPAADRYKAAD